MMNEHQHENVAWLINESVSCWILACVLINVASGFITLLDFCLLLFMFDFSVLFMYF